MQHLKILYALLGVSLLAAFAPQQVDALARLIRIPLTRATTQGAGQLGQPVVNYYTQINIGTPPKPFKVQFDLETDELFVPHYSWNPFNTNLHYSDGFQCKLSSTCVKNDAQYVVDYQRVKLTGKRYEDLMTLSAVRSNETLQVGASSSASGNATTNAISTGVNSPTWRQNFLSISSASDGRFRSLPVDGFFGLAPGQQSMSSVRNILTSLHAANLIDNLQISMWFNPLLDSPQGGELIIGGVDVDRYQGQVYWHHLSPLTPNQWLLSLQHVSLGNEVVSCAMRGCQAKFSSGTSDIYGPREDVARIYALLNTTKSSSGLELVDCRRVPSLPYITFFIDGIPYYLLSSNYIRKTLDGSIFKKETCYVAILPSNDASDNKTWTLATPFLGAYYSIFDVTYRQIGFAALR